MMTRRTALAAFGAGALALRGQVPSQPAPAPHPKSPKRPVVCVSSNAMTGIGYAEIGEIAKQLGFEGVDITMMRGGLVEPSQAPVDEVRAFESLHGAGLATPIATTALRSASEPWCRTLLALAGRDGVGLYKCGIDQANPPAVAKRAAFGLAVTGAQYGTAMLVRVGSSSRRYGAAEAEELLQGLPREWSGIALHAEVLSPASGWPEAKIQALLPRVRAIDLGDRDRAGLPVPMGKGTVDLPRLFRLLADAGFEGPITVEREYRAADEPSALAADAEVIRKQIDRGYGKAARSGLS